MSIQANSPIVNGHNFETLPDDAIVRLPVVLAVTGWRKTQFYCGVKAGEIPAPVKLGRRARGWRVGDLRQYLRSLESVRA